VEGEFQRDAAAAFGNQGAVSPIPQRGGNEAGVERGPECVLDLDGQIPWSHHAAGHCCRIMTAMRIGLESIRRMAGAAVVPGLAGAASLREFTHTRSVSSEYRAMAAMAGRYEELEGGLPAHGLVCFLSDVDAHGPAGAGARQKSSAVSAKHPSLLVGTS
jgi:hypothetical protein